MKQQQTKAQLLQRLLMELAKNSKYTKSIFKKYAAIGAQMHDLDQSMLELETSIHGNMITANPGLTKEKINEYVQSNKMPSKLRPEIENMIREIYGAMHDFSVKIPLFNWMEIKKMDIGAVDVLITYGLVDTRKFMFLFKKGTREF